MLGYINGRIYYTLSNWYTLFGLLPFGERFKPAWQEAAGVEKSANDVRLRKKISRINSLLFLFYSCIRLTWMFMWLSLYMRNFRRRVGSVYAEYWLNLKDKLNDQPAHQVINDYHKMRVKLLKGWQITIVNDLYAIVFSSLLRKLLKSYSQDSEDKLYNQLLCGSSRLESALPLYSAVQLSAEIETNSKLERLLMEVVENGHSTDWRDRLSASEFGEFANRVDQHLQQYGDRSLEELKLETVTFRDDPGLFFRMLLSYARQRISIESLHCNAEQVRGNVRLPSGGNIVSALLRRLLIKLVLHFAIRSIGFREAARLDRSRAFGIVRNLFIRIGQALEQQKLLKDKTDIFYLSCDEIESYLHGYAMETELASLVMRRKLQYAAYAKLETNERLETGNWIYTNISQQTKTPACHSSQQQFFGTGCGTGRVRGQACIVSDPKTVGNIEGRILIAPNTDPGWIFLMTAASGLVVEKGNILSHTAIIGRELGIPTVVGVSGATRNIPDGAWVELDGDDGTVTLLAAGGESEQ